MKHQMLAFFIAFVIAAWQITLLYKIIRQLKRPKVKQIKKLCFIKFLIYGVAIYLLVFRFIGYTMPCFCGFISGAPLTALVMYIYLNYLKDYTIKFKGYLPVIVKKRKRRYY